MSAGIRPELPAEGPGAPPRENGELVFAAPWEGRAFGMTLALCDQGLYPWDEFRSELIAEIARWERAHPDGAGWSYYARWLAALENVLASKRICPPTLLDQRTAEYAARSHGHDHPHLTDSANHAQHHVDVSDAETALATKTLPSGGAQGD